MPLQKVYLDKNIYLKHLYIINCIFLVTEPGRENQVDLKDIKVIRKLGGTTEDTELVEGLVFTQKSAGVNGPKKVDKAKIGLIQFCISPPKTAVSCKPLK